MAIKVPLNDLTAQYRSIQGEIQGAISSVIENSAFIGGPAVSRFEADYGKFCGGVHAAGVSNGTDALMLALIALGLKPGDEVIIPAQSFIATLEPIFHLGGKPIIVDCTPDTLNLDPSKIEAALTARTRFIIPVHLYGHPAEMPAINAIARKHGLRVIEDAAQAHGAEIDGVRIGQWGDLATFSFFPGKNLGAYGDAGGVVSRDPALIDEVRRLRNHGREKGAKYEHCRIGFNFRMDALQAAVLAAKLPHMEKWNERRREIARQYTHALGAKVKVPVEKTGYQSVYHIYAIEVLNRGRFMTKMQEQGIQTGIHYPIPMHLHAPVIERLGDQRGKFPVAERSAERVVSLPIYPEMTSIQVDQVIQATLESLE